jgi:hypothetical protein
MKLWRMLFGDGKISLMKKMDKKLLFDEILKVEEILMNDSLLMVERVALERYVKDRYKEVKKWQF